MRQRDAAVTGGGKKKPTSLQEVKSAQFFFFSAFDPEISWPLFFPFFLFSVFFSFVPSSQSVNVFCLFLRWHNPRDVEQQKSKWLPVLSAYQCVNSPRFSLVTYLRSTLKVKTNQAIRITTAPTFTLFFFFFLISIRDELRGYKLRIKMTAFGISAAGCGAFIHVCLTCLW